MYIYIYIYFILFYFNLVIYLFSYFLTHRHKEVREGKKPFYFLFFLFWLRLTCQKDFTSYLDPNMAQG